MGFLFIILLSGCDQSSVHESEFENYLQRIASVQQQNRVILNEFETVIPRKRDLYQPPSRQTIGIIDSMQLSQCNLLGQIMERNTVLGKVQDQFKNLEYQVSLLNGLSNCLSGDHLSIELNAQLRTIYNIKWQELPLHISNLLYTSSAMYSNAYANDWYDPNFNSGYNELQQLLIRVKALYQHHQNSSLPDNFHILELQELIEKHDQLGRMTYSLQQATVYLQAAQQQLSSFDHTIYCGLNRDTTKYQRLKNVFYKYYVGQIQPYMAKVDAAYQGLSPYLDIFYTQHSTATYHHPVKSAYTEYRVASIAPAKYWMSLFDRCGDSIGS
jgi:hypothetical protein